MPQTPEVDESRLGVLTRIAGGSQGIVYTAPNVKLSARAAGIFKNGQSVYKEYTAAVLPDLDFAGLRDMVQLPEALPDKDKVFLYERAAWPVAIVKKSGREVGFVMPMVPDDFFLGVKVPSGLVKRSMGKIALVLNDESVLAKTQIPITDKQRYILLADVAETLDFLHKHRIAVGDMSANNLLFSLSSRPRGYFVDCDAMAIANKSISEQMESPGWQVRNISQEPKGTEDSDLYKFGLLVLRLIAGSQLAADISMLPKHVPAGIRDLVERALSPRPGSRPRASEWVQPLKEASNKASTKAPQWTPPPPPVTRSVTTPSFVTVTTVNTATPLTAPPGFVNVPTSPPTPQAFRAPGLDHRRRWMAASATVIVAIAIIAMVVTSSGGGHKIVSPPTAPASNLTSAVAPSAKAAAEQLKRVTPTQAQTLLREGHQLWWYNGQTDSFVSEETQKAPPNSVLYGNEQWLTAPTTSTVAPVQTTTASPPPTTEHHTVVTATTAPQATRTTTAKPKSPAVSTRNGLHGQSTGGGSGASSGLSGSAR